MARTAIRPARILSVLTGMALAAGVASAVAAPPPAAHAAGSHPLATPDQRTRHSVTHRNANGSFTTTVSAEPMNYRDGKGNWQPIDSRLVPAQRTGYAYRNAANDFTALFKAASDAGYLRVEVAGVPLDLSLAGAAARTARVSGTQVSYPSVMDGVDLRYVMAAGGVKETLVLADANAPTHYQFLLTAPQHRALSVKRLSNGAWAFMAPGHAGPLFELAPPQVDEAARVTGNQIQAGGRPAKDVVGLAVARTDHGFRLDLTIDPAWLQAPQRRFPVLLDPTIEVQPSLQTGLFVADCATCTNNQSSVLWVGTDTYDVWRATVQ
ncbi:MAG TPA: hypothetical protein VFU36_07600, partial [Jatrophihabitans sp.]|nr:hypothetical protein [Jatrophihabitans sp.]